jgi:two-component system cell cycle sensor histidine kinase/response regulator CckA
VKPVIQPKKTLETILVVEEHPVVRDVVREILERAGFCVLTAGSGAQAIYAESITRGTIDLLLSDVMMMDMSGPVIAQLLKIHRPEMRVMLMSGYADGDMLYVNHGWRFIEKPFLPSELVARVNDVLHTPERSQGDDHFYTPMQPKTAAAAV